MARKIQWNQWLTLILWIILCGGCMWTMLVYASEKTIVIADLDRGATVYLAPESIGDIKGEAEPLSFRMDSTVTGRLSIPLEAGLRADRVMVENRYMDKELWIYVKEGDRDFYRSFGVRGDISPVLSGVHEAQGEDIVFKIQMRNVFEYRSILEEGNLIVEYFLPKEVFDRIIVIDPIWGEEESSFIIDGYSEYRITEKDVVLEIVRELKERIDLTDMKAYYTRIEDMEVTLEERADIANQVTADMFIGIGVSSDIDEPEKYGIGCLYNQLYFIPGLGNLELSNLVAQHVVTAVSGRAEGIFPASEDSVLAFLKIPGVQLQVGYLSNPIESQLLGQQEYIEKLVDGILEAIEEAYLLMD